MIFGLKRNSLAALVAGISVAFSAFAIPSMASPAIAANNAATATAATTDNPSAIDWSRVESGNCLVIKAGFGFKACSKGQRDGYWNVAFIGDSHMRQFFAPLDVLAFRYHWRVTFISKSACTVANHKQYPISRYHNFSCRSWNRALEKYFAAHKPFDLIVNSNSAFDSHANVAMAHAFKTTVLSQTTRGTKWLLFSDNPKPQPNFEACIAAHPATAERVCRLPYSQAMKPIDLLPRTVHQIPGVLVADFHKAYCPHECPAVINGIVVYRDYSHISSDWAQQMLPLVDAAIPEEFKHKPRS